MNDLLREHAPIPDAAWKEIDAEATRTLKVALGARKLVDFTGPLGWETSAINLGRAIRMRAGPTGQVQVRQRQVMPLVELRVPFELKRAELEDISRGAADPDLGPVIEAAQAIALGEDTAVFRGYKAAGITGICEANLEKPLSIPSDYLAYPGIVAEAMHELRARGIAGPYGIALGPRCFTGLNKTMAPNGYPVIEHLRRLLEGPAVSVPAVDGAVVMSLRGGDFEMIVGRDLSIGYLDHDKDAVRFYIEESLTFRAIAPEAAVVMAYPSRK